MSRSTLFDITDRKEVELEMQRREQWYRALAGNLPKTTVFLFDHDLRYLIVEGEAPTFPLKSRFLSIASHEFRNPLAVIMTSADLMSRHRDNMTEVQIAERLKKIQGQVNHLRGIVQDVLELEGMQQGRIRFNPEEADLDALCREILEEFRTSPGQIHELAYSGLDWPVLASLDVRMMRQVVTNLLSNAVKYSPDGHTVWVSLAHEADSLVLHVRDEGIGIPPEEINRLFTAFHRAENVGNIPGIGLGLNIIKQAVELHGGSVSLESTINVGTTFSVTLPV
jgi:signal transduction histidine kinase